MRGVFCKTILRSQLASPGLSDLFAAVIAVVGSRFPAVTELLVHRLLAQLKAGYKNQDRVLCFATARFIAHLSNQQVVTEDLVLQFLSTCLLDPSDGSVELAVTTLRDCAPLLTEKSPLALDHIIQRLRQLLHNGKVSKKAQVMIENLINARRRRFDKNDVLNPKLDLLYDEDIIVHFVYLDEDEGFDLQYECDNFQFDSEYEQNEREYEVIKKDILGAAVYEFEKNKNPFDASHGVSNGKRGATSDEEGTEAAAKKPVDMTEAELVDFQRTIYLTVNSSLSYEEWGHKLLRLMRSNPGREAELCRMIVECCSQEKTYIRGYGLVAQRFCMLNRIYVSHYEDLFAQHYATIHRLDMRKIRNVANFYASVLAADVLPWTVFELVRIVEDETTASSRIFLKILFQEISNTLGLSSSKKRFEKADIDGHLDGVFPADNASNARFSINFFRSIGLGYLADNLCKRLETLPTKSHIQDDDSSSLSSSSASSSSLSSSSMSPSSGEEGHMEDGHAENEQRSGKHHQEHSPPAESERRNGLRYASTGRSGLIRDRASEDARVHPFVRGSPRSQSRGVGGLSYDEVEKNHRAYVNGSSPQGSKRIGNRVNEEEDDLHLDTRKRRRRDSPSRSRNLHWRAQEPSGYARSSRYDRGSSESDRQMSDLATMSNHHIFADGRTKKARVSTYRREGEDHSGGDYAIPREGRRRRSRGYSVSTYSSDNSDEDRGLRRIRYTSPSSPSKNRDRARRTYSDTEARNNYRRYNYYSDHSEDRLSLRSRSRSPSARLRRSPRRGRARSISSESSRGCNERYADADGQKRGDRGDRLSPTRGMQPQLFSEGYKRDVREYGNFA